MNTRAWFYVGLIYLLGAVLLGFSILVFEPKPFQLPAFLVFTTLATLAQLFKSEAPSHQAYHPALIFVFAGALLLDPFLFAILIVVSHLIEWLKERLSTKGEHLSVWYIQPFNISMHIILGLTARTIFQFINPDPSSLASGSAILAAALAVASYVLLNHLMVGLALVLARGISLKASGILEIENLSTDFVMFTIGYVSAILFRLNPLLILPTLTPLYLVYRALAVPQLEQKANTDPKTGLWNAEYFIEALELERRRGKRFEHHLTVVMADIDFLRNINNTYGHLGGDAVLVGVAQILKKNFREFDIIARFGGEEFAMLLPETSPQSAYARIEKVRRIVEKADFVNPTTQAHIKTTMSFGISGSNGHEMSTGELIHNADIAVYDAKLKGRNRTSIYSEKIANTLGLSGQN